MKHFFSILFLLLTITIQAQVRSDYNTLSAYNRHKFSVGLGTMYYSGEISMTPKNLRPAVSLTYGYPVKENIVLRLTLTGSQYGAADSLSSGNRQSRNLSFSSNFAQLSGIVTWEFMKYRRSKFFKNTHLSPYVLYGLSLFYFNPRAKYNGQWYSLQPLGTEGQFLPERYGSYPKPYERIQFALPLGGGLSYYLNEKWSINAEVIGYKTFTDYMDDVSSSYYPNLDALATQNPVAAALSAPSTNPLFERSLRGNPLKKDFFMIPTFSVTFHMNQKKIWNTR